MTDMYVGRVPSNQNQGAKEGGSTADKLDKLGKGLAAAGGAYLLATVWDDPTIIGLLNDIPGGILLLAGGGIVLLGTIISCAETMKPLPPEISPTVKINGPFSARVGEEVIFAGSSDDPEATYDWIFSEGVEEIDRPTPQSITLVFNEPGTYEIKLKVVSGGQAKTISQNITIVPAEAPLVSIIAPYSATVNTDVSFSTTPEPGVTYTWYFADGSTASGDSVYHRFTKLGTYMVRLEAEDIYGVKSSITQNISIVPGPVPVVSIIAPYSATVNTEVSFSTTPEPGVTYTWYLGDGTIFPGDSISHSYSELGTYMVRLEAVDASGQKNSITQNISIVPFPIPMPIFTASTTVGPVPLTVDFDASGSYGVDGAIIVNYSWNWGDGGTDSGVAPTNTYDSAGTYTVRLVVTDNYGATNSSTMTIGVYTP